MLCGYVIDCWTSCNIDAFSFKFCEWKSEKVVHMSWIKVAPAFCRTAHLNSLFSRKLFITFRDVGHERRCVFWYLFFLAVHSNYSNFHVFNWCVDVCETWSKLVTLSFQTQSFLLLICLFSGSFNFDRHLPVLFSPCGIEDVFPSPFVIWTPPRELEEKWDW